MRALHLLTLMRLREFIREPGALFWTFGFPLLLTVALGLAFRQEGPPSLTIAVIAGPEAEATAATLQQPAKPGSAALRLTPKIMTVAQAEIALRKAQVVLAVDPNRSGHLQFMLDPARPDAENARLVVGDTLQRRAGRQDVMTSSEVVSQRAGGRYIDWLVPGLLGMQLMSGGMWGVGWTLVEIRSRKLLKRLVATPMKRSHFLLSFMLARLMAVWWEVGVLILFAALTFGVRVQGSWLDLIALSLLGAASFSGLGLLTASRAQNTQTAGGLMNLVMLPMFMLSSVFFSAVNFPDWLQPVIHALPLTALNDALRAVMNEGTSIVEVASRVGILAVWGVVSFVLALRLFRWA